MKLRRTETSLNAVMSQSERAEACGLGIYSQIISLSESLFQDLGHGWKSRWLQRRVAASFLLIAIYSAAASSLHTNLLRVPSTCWGSCS